MKATVVITVAVEVEGSHVDLATLDGVRAAIVPVVEQSCHRMTARGVRVGDVRASALIGDDPCAAIARAMGAA